ncbi:MAG: hypothetical protein H6818_18920 [Phycisphaerales bacterium]|nr:hypothetical protein [Phycisphaerales bacterium]MCB9863821.1 hypothetical protein [Phycisphaerales bacterium]
MVCYDSSQQGACVIRAMFVLFMPVLMLLGLACAPPADTLPMRIGCLGSVCADAEFIIERIDNSTLRITLGKVTASTIEGGVIRAQRITIWVDLDHDGWVDSSESIVDNGILDVDEDLDGDGHFDVDEPVWRITSTPPPSSPGRMDVRVKRAGLVGDSFDVSLAPGGEKLMICAEASFDVDAPGDGGPISSGSIECGLEFEI